MYCRHFKQKAINKLQSTKHWFLPWFPVVYRFSFKAIEVWILPGSWDPWRHLVEGLHGGDRSGSSAKQLEWRARGGSFFCKKVLAGVSWLVSWLVGSLVSFNRLFGGAKWHLWSRGRCRSLFSFVFWTLCQGLATRGDLAEAKTHWNWNGTRYPLAFDIFRPNSHTKSQWPRGTWKHQTPYWWKDNGQQMWSSQVARSISLPCKRHTRMERRFCLVLKGNVLVLDRFGVHLPECFPHLYRSCFFWRWSKWSHLSVVRPLAGLVQTQMKSLCFVSRLKSGEGEKERLPATKVGR